VCNLRVAGGSLRPESLSAASLVFVIWYMYDVFKMRIAEAEERVESARVDVKTLSRNLELPHLSRRRARGGRGIWRALHGAANIRYSVV